MRKRITAAVCVTIAVCLLCLQACQSAKSNEQDNLQQSASAAETGGADGAKEASAETGGTGGAKEASAETGGTEKAGEAESAPTETAGEESTETPAGTTALSEKPAAAKEIESASVSLSPGMEEMKEYLEDYFQKNGKWSMYFYRFDTGEEFGINEQDSMIAASLIKLFIAGCYFDQIEKGVINDDYPNQLFTMISESNNGSTNTLIDVLGMDTINEFIRTHGFEASWLKRKMLVQNGLENYTSAEDCGHVLREVYEGTYVNEEASSRIMDAMKAQIANHKYKIPAGVPQGVTTANKSGELYTTDENGANVMIENDAAIIFAPAHNYILVVMTSSPPTGEGVMFAQIAALSAVVYEDVCNGESDTDSAEEESAETGDEEEADTQDTAETDDSESGTVTEEEILDEGDTESVSEDAAVVFPEQADADK